MIRRPPRSTQSRSSAASDVYKRQTMESDWPQIRELRIENATDNPISYGATLHTTQRMDVDAWRLRGRRGEGPDTASLAAIDTTTGRWVGMMSGQLGDEDGPQAVLTGVYVSPDYRGRQFGIADALLDEVEPVSYTHLRAHETRHDLVCR